MKAKDMSNEELLQAINTSAEQRWSLPLKIEEASTVKATYRILNKELLSRLEAGKNVKEILKEDLIEYLQHDSWRCGYHQTCHCGLDELTDKLELNRVPLPQKGS